VLLRLVAITFIFCCTLAAWMVLGVTILQRTYDADKRLRNRVESIWGSPQEQLPPAVVYERTVARPVTEEIDGKKITRTVPEIVAEPLPLVSSNIEANLDLEHRQKGLLWYSTYRVQFKADYEIDNPTGKDQWVVVTLPFPAEKAVYDNLTLTADGQPLPFQPGKSSVMARTLVRSGQPARIGVGYTSQGLDSWHYKFGSEVAQVRDFRLKVITNFRNVDFSDDALAPTEKNPTADGWQLTWNYHNLLSGIMLGVVLPQKLQPGPFAGKVSFFAPVSLFFYFFLLFIITAIRRIDLHPMNYFFLAGAFFSFHLLLAYLVDHMSVHLAFFISSVVSLFLAASYLRIVVGLQFALVEAGLAQFIYLVLFSYAFFFEGFTGLTITIGSILTLFVVMQMSARTKWDQVISQGARSGTAAGGVGETGDSMGRSPL
jgi:inner membrane protein involved in colicin E2 resistance